MRRIELCHDETVIGRRAGCDVIVSDMEASRRHARLLRVDDHLFVEDLDSRHGTFLNGRRVSRSEVQPGDTIAVGQNRFELETDSPAGAVTSERLGASDETTAFQVMFRELTESPAKPTEKDSGLDKLSMLLDFEYHWKQSFPADALFRRVLEIALRISGAQRGYVLRRTGNDFQYQLGLDDKLAQLSEDQFRTSRTVVARAVDSAEPVFMTEGISGDLAFQESIVRQKLRAVACLPLIGVGPDGQSSEVLGVLYLDSKSKMHALSGLDERILRKVGSEASNVLEKIERIRDIEERQQMERELSLARETQRSLLPRYTPDLPGFDLQAFCRPTRYVGGDFYDFFVVGDVTHVVLADVSGKGIAASLLSSSLQGALHMQLLSGNRPEEVLGTVNEYMCARTEDDRFATLVMVSLRADGSGVFLGAGHIPSYLYRAGDGSLEEILTGDLPLGMFEEVSYTRREFVLNPGDLLLLLSDGLTEAVDPAGQLFGEERLKDLLCEHAPRGTVAVERAVKTALEAFVGGRDQADDITVVLLGRRRDDDN